MSIATSFAAGPKGQFGTSTKPLHAGMSARNAVEAALLAQAGMNGRLDILERPQGFLDLFGGEASAGWQALSASDDHVIETHGLVTKLHPCCASTHRAIDAARSLQTEYGFSLDDVLSIQTKVGRSAVDNLAYPDPMDEMQARFSMQYCLATALYQARLSLTDFTGTAILRPEIRRHMPKISMSAYSAAEEQGIERLPHQVIVNLSDGRTLKTERLHATGSVAMPLTAADRHSKFADCQRWAGLKAEGTHGALLQFEDAASVKDFLNGFEWFAIS